MSCLGSSRPRIGACVKNFAASEALPRELWTRPLRNVASSLGSCRLHLRQGGAILDDNCGQTTRACDTV